MAMPLVGTHCLKLYRYFASDAGVHQFPYHAIVAIHALQKHQLGQGCLNSAVVTRHHTCIFQLKVS